MDCVVLYPISAHFMAGFIQEPCQYAGFLKGYIERTNRFQSINRLEDHLKKNTGPVIQKVDNALHSINLYLLDNVIGFPNTYPLDSNLSSG